MSCAETLGKLILLSDIQARLIDEVNDAWCEGISNELTDNEIAQLERCDKWLTEQNATLNDIIFRLRKDNFCKEEVELDDTVQVCKNGSVWHLRCKDRHDTAERRKSLMEPKMNEADLGAWARWSAASGAKPVMIEADPMARTINYTITPRRFILDIPVEALANLSGDAHTRMLAMLNAWIVENKPPRTRDEKVSKP